MNNFSALEEKYLINQIWTIHDKIFSLPSKRIIFFFLDDVIGGTIGFAYDCLDIINNKQVKLIRNKNELDNYKFLFGDLLIIGYCENAKNIKNDFIFIKNAIYKDFPLHYSIITNVNFLYYRAYAQLYRESIESYVYKNNINYPLITKLNSFEKIFED